MDTTSETLLEFYLLLYVMVDWEGPFACAYLSQKKTWAGVCNKESKGLFKEMVPSLETQVNSALKNVASSGLGKGNIINHGYYGS